jgi:biopolymer transport protein ExbB
LQKLNCIKIEKYNNMSNAKNSNGAGFAAIVIPATVLVAILIYKFIFGAQGNFVDLEKHTPKTGNFLGMIYTGGLVVPVLISLFLMVWIFFFERIITLGKAAGKGNVGGFVRKIKTLLAGREISTAIAECDKQQGSVANVIRAGLVKYQEMEKDQVLDKEKKIIAIQKDIEEATQLEMPMMERNLVVLSTIASIATLMGLFGTVLGMIRSFAALAASGGGDANALALGISEALINTALGIGTSALAIIYYNYFTNKIDTLTHGIDEAGFSIVQTFAASK